MGDDRTRNNPDEANESGRRESKTVRLLRKRIRKQDERIAKLEERTDAVEETNKLLLDRTAEQAEQIESVIRLLHGKPEDPKDSGLKGIVEHQASLWRIVVWVGGPIITIATSVITAGMVYWTGLNK